MTLFRFQIQHTSPDGNEFVTHDLTCLILVTHGTGTLLTTPTRHSSPHRTLTTGDVLVINSGVRYRFAESSDLHYYHILFDTTQFIESAHDITALPGYHALFVVEPMLLQQGEIQETAHFPAKDRHHIIQLIEQIQDEYSQKRPGYQTFVAAYFLQFVAQLARQYVPPESSEYIWRLGKVAAFVELHYQESITLEELASIAGMSINHFMRVFKKLFGLTPIEYVIHQRVQKACLLMKMTDWHISEIADEVGFSDGNYFARQFRKVMGRTPREFRKDAQAITL